MEQWSIVISPGCHSQFWLGFERDDISLAPHLRHLLLSTSLHPSLSHIDGGRRVAHDRDMSRFDALAEDIKAFGKSILDAST